ncbi:chitin-binding domain protein cbd-1 isoform X3 [Patella vulgata]|uniref:chitin-binding domain protein cbd-1 isoform X3 n=1 Tax=Patella vulgata TaxID=6465 RepID=UPI0024A90C50|nr:chitin-binding domain protein cbd-1 isoform X3 [Patella vulgata]
MWISYIVSTVLVISHVTCHQFLCPIIDGLYPHPTDCDKYYQCSNRIGTQLNCVPGTYWSESNSVCSWPDDVPECDKRGRRGLPSSSKNSKVDITDEKGDPTELREETRLTTVLDNQGINESVPFHAMDFKPSVVPRTSAVETSSGTLDTEDVPASTTITYAAESFFSDFRCPNIEGFYRDPFNCRNYYYCINWAPYKRICPPQEFFDNDILGCAPKSEVEGCLYYGEPENMEFLTPTTPGKVQFNCPKDHGYYPDLDDCSFYFECILGNAFRRQCMHGTLFDRVRNKCTWENLVRDCKSLTRGDKDIITKGSVVVEFDCPEPDGYYRKPDNCRAYYHCIDNNAALLECESGSLFDVYLGKCTWSKMVSDCDENDKPIDTIKVQQTVDIQQNQSNDQVLVKRPVLNVGVIDYRSFKCPEEEGYFRDIEDCAVYYFCTKWKVYQHQCKPGTVFDMVKHICTWPHLVDGCDETKESINQDSTAASTGLNSENTEIRFKEPISPTLPTETIEQHGENLPDINAITEASSITFVCPPIYDGYYGDPISCSRFYRCIGGEMYTFSCPRGTYFDNLRFLCNFESEVTDCTTGGIRNTMISQNDEGESSFDHPPPDFNAVNLQCPERDGVFAHPRSCSKFIYCTKYIPKIYECPRDLVYNIHIHTCDYPDDVVCKLYD